MPKTLPSDIQTSIQTLLENSIDPTVIGKRVGVHRNTVNRPSIVTESTRRYIKRQVLTGYLKTTKDVQMKLEEIGHAMSYQSAINVLHSVEVYAEIKKRKPLLTKKHKKARLAWAKKHQYWTGSDGCKYYWKQKCDRLQPHLIDVTVKREGGGLMLWGCITSEGFGYACEDYNNAMNSELYQEILATSMKDTMEYYGLNWKTSVFQHDNDPKHRPKSTTQWMKDSGMVYIDDWPSQSPDLNPIEHVWHHLKLKLSMYDSRTTSIHELWERVENEWNSFTKE
ncbi:hypothetical protein G6F60_012466 [Rhizopus arrhizus]|uniref:Tc1-like transposase DDE domain-containing protein n=1 Tax=Rhizopus oryzae TaxID=64495 RepID=A0A9P6WY01_RHIOR|nr:hypothetical protein G6F33_012567 [Rhizopus arrhizus]KAG0927154.1 hypothetical protein G6F32_012968 [Rhizopus arrhizus]KAG1300832.1 hypothetical protein G6F64_012343 [Rhizopus arrhizus]KAG1369129.1 hypothetical protein G6F61_012601 [Rhizopus arrhizus]KAG1391633.1 hypothetical protein G6F60_012466 [Rhizopus arrhizus]